MNCDITTLADIVDSAHLGLYLRNKVCKSGSDFQWKLTALLHGDRPADATDGSIALVFDQGEVVGWARTEYWTGGDDGAGGFVSYDTLEAFVVPEYRLRGVAAFAASGLYAGVLHDNGGAVAVFHPHMLLVAKRAGFVPVLFTKSPAGKWVKG